LKYTYSGDESTGSLNWSSSWVDEDPKNTGLPNLPSTSGGILTKDDPDTSGNIGLSIEMSSNTTIGMNIYRDVDLSAVSSASLNFDVVYNNLSKAGDQIVIQASNDGGANYTDFITLDSDSPLTGYSFDLISLLGSVSATTRIRIIVTAQQSNARRILIDNVEIAYTIPGSAGSAVFSQSTVMCSDFTILGGQAVTITSYATVTSGTMPANPDIDAVLEYGAGSTNILSLANPSWDGSKLTWTGTLGSDVTIPAGEAVTLVTTTNESVVAFTIDYDSQTKPSKIELPTDTFININAYAIYDAPYPGGSIISGDIASQTVYIRSLVSDPFGFDDITGLEYEITDPASGVSTIRATEVATAGCTKTYELAWTVPAIVGNYEIKATTHEGTEGVQDTDTIFFNATVPITVTKVITNRRITYRVKKN